jgi:serine/threonine-protein kinase HipA
MRIDLHLDGAWVRCAELTLTDPGKASRYGAVTLAYDVPYARKHLLATDLRALAVGVEVNLARRSFAKWPAFLIDLLPQGAAKKRLERDMQLPTSDWELLERGALNPAGNLRIVPPGHTEPRPHPGFELPDMLERGEAFLDYAIEVGAAVAGSTDAQGDSPKYWVVQDHSGKWHPDAGQLGASARHWALLKFPVAEAGTRATDMLRNEASYQQVAKVLGLRVTEELPKFMGGALLIPRFDRRVGAVGEIRLGVESIYSVTGILDSAHESLSHHQALIELRKGIGSTFDGEMLEYFKRDALNLAMGNRDNHGRNTAILKETDHSMKLAPLFDFGPAYLDARNIARTLRWDSEHAGVVDWSQVLTNLVDRFADAGLHAPDFAPVAQGLQEFGKSLNSLPEIMLECGVDASIVDARGEDINRLCRSLIKVVPP